MRINLAWDEPPEDPEPQCARCEAPQSWCCCLPIVVCPQCGEEHDDADGFGVLMYCEDCGWCVHSSITDCVCDACGCVTHAA